MIDLLTKTLHVLFVIHYSWPLYSHGLLTQRLFCEESDNCYFEGQHFEKTKAFTSRLLIDSMSSAVFFSTNDEALMPSLPVSLPCGEMDIVIS
jgi:hypothetical protein